MAEKNQWKYGLVMCPRHSRSAMLEDRANEFSPAVDYRFKSTLALQIVGRIGHGRYGRRARLSIGARTVNIILIGVYALDAEINKDKFPFKCSFLHCYLMNEILARPHALPKIQVQFRFSEALFTHDWKDVCRCRCASIQTAPHERASP